MIDLNINGKIYRHPSKIEEVTLGQYIAIQAVEQSEGDTDINNSIKSFSEFASIPIDVLLQAPTKELLYHISLVHELLGDISDIDTTPPKTIKIGKTTYKVNQDIDGAEMAQYIDCTHYMNVMQSSPEFYPYMLAIYCLKGKERYNKGKYDLTARAKQMMQCNVIDALRVNAFFLHTSENFLQDSLRYLGAK
jgi:hypothetical protein